MIRREFPLFVIFAVSGDEIPLLWISGTILEVFARQVYGRYSHVERLAIIPCSCSHNFELDTVHC